MKFFDLGREIYLYLVLDPNWKRAQDWFSEASSRAFRKNPGARVGLLVSLLTKTSTRVPVQVLSPFSL
jgi:hypothetical protein